jgi:GNAT superfamily N-acetyltransferase
MPSRAPVRLRPAGLADLDVLVAHRRAMWVAIADYSNDELDAGDPVYRRWARRMMRQRRLLAWIAEDESGQPIGSGAVWLTEAQPRPGELAPWRPYILSMYTDEGHRGKGIASTIVRTAVNYARDHGFSRITLHASEMGRPVYRRLGFERSWEMRQRFDVPPTRRSVPARRRRVR